jgi:hypothetical protein
MTTPPELETPIRSATDLLHVWRRLMGDGGFGRSTLWLIFLDEDDRLQRLIMPIDDLPVRPDDRFVGNLALILGELHETGEYASTAMLLSRPGPAQMTDADRRWARALHARLAGLSPWPLHLATRDRVQVFAPDDLIAA